MGLVMSKNKFMINADRRRFLKTAAHAGLSTAFLHASTLATGMMLGRSAHAMTGINKVVCVYVPGGAPTQGGNSLFVPSSNLVLPAASAPFESVKDECVFFSDAAVTGGGGHGFTSKTLGASVHSNTYDVELERTLGANSPFPSLLLGVQSNDGNHGSATRKDNREVTYQDNPIATFNRLFNGNVSVGSIDSQRSQSVLDIQKAEIVELQKVLGSAEKERLDEHLTAIEKMQERLQSQADQNAIAACSSPVWNTGNFNYNANDKTQFTTLSNLQSDLAVLALRCNYTRVVSIMLSNHQSDHSVPQLNWSDTYHQSIHGGSVATYTETRAYLSSRVAYLIEQLKAATDEFGNSLLDSTLVVQVTDMGDGNAHSSTNAPMLLAGGGAAIQRGQLANCGNHVNIFDTMTEAMGLTGLVPQYGSGALSGIIR